jgi:D-amino-acid dehydrogenase
MPTTAPVPEAAPPPDPDVLIVGGGVVGLFCAFFLRRDGHRVVVVDRGPIGGPASCSSGNTGFVGTQGAAPLAGPGALDVSSLGGLLRLLDPRSPLYLRPHWDTGLARWLWQLRRVCNDRDAASGFRVLLEMKLRSLAILREICSEPALASTFTSRGMVLAYRTAVGFERARRSVPAMVAAGVPLRLLDGSELRALEPDVELTVHGALFNDDGAALRVPDFLLRFADVLRAMGVEIYPDTEVLGFETEHRAVTRVRTTRGDVRPRETVIAAGTWSVDCARMLNLRLLLQPVRGYSITTPTSPGAPTRPIALIEGRVAVMPLGDRLRVAGSLELSGRGSAPPDHRLATLARTVERYLPRLELTRSPQIWSGLRPCTPDSLPLVGRAAHLNNVSVACGHGHIGMGLAPVTGRLVAQIVSGERPDLNLGPLRPSRFDERR